MIEGISAIAGLGRTAGPTAPQAPSPSGGVSFEDALGQAVGSAIDTLKAGEATAIQGVEGAVAADAGGRIGHGRPAVAAVGARDPRQARVRLAGHFADVDLSGCDLRK